MNQPEGMDTQMTTDRHTVAGAHMRIDGHEELCAERHANVLNRLDDLSDGQKWVQRGMVAVLIMALGWCGSQLWGTVQHGAAQAQTVGVARASP